ncbi:hypothetical protein H6P81_012894 [Aristolochia fimbriata]|uniref:Pentatricopeptide repeat-containing protein n=1 Tax=Aristolochia fimbriata TaxID=158543 RepID=A0AAV7EEC5_ARIFI|nr:hypothetical protein H6P81_012894 [Aristolochia fimbriata]
MGISTPTRNSIVSAIKHYVSQGVVSEGKAIHAQIIKCGFLPETLLYNHLLNIYCKSSDYVSAERVFDEMPEKNLVSFATLISGYSRSHNPQSAYLLVPRLQEAGLSPNNFVFSSLILTCSKLLSVDRGKQIHSQVIVSGFETDPFVRTSLVDMYSKFNDLNSATSIFGQCTVSDPIMYNSMISGLVSFGSFEEAVYLFVKARRDFDLRPSEFTFGSLIKASANIEIEVGEQVHVFSIKTGLDFDCFVGTSLVDMYGRFGDMESSEKVFRSILSLDIALYNAIIVGFSQNSLDEKALQFYQELRSRGLIPSDVTFSSILRACGSLKHVKLGKIIHGMIQSSEFHKDLAVNTALIDMYMKCGCVEESWKVFRRMPNINTISYNSMICGLGQNGKFYEAVKLFIDMKCLYMEPDHATFVVLMSSCLGHERISYVHAIKHGFGSDAMVQNSLLDGLVKAGFMNEAQELFHKMPQRTVISWTTIISGLSQLGCHSDALELFKSMQLAAISPNCFTISCILKACGNLANLDHGRCIHACSIKHGTDDDEFTNSSLLDMYANCGALGDSLNLFEELPKKDVVSWNSMITGCAQHGKGAESLKLLGDMDKYGVRPNHVTFVSLLTSCSRSGLVDEGVHIFESMTPKYGIVPCMEHYACLVDMFGRVGMLDRVKRLIESMPFEPDVSIWKIVLAACKLHADAELAKIAGDHVLGSDHQEKASFVAIQNVLSMTHNWDEAAETRKKMRDLGLRKDPGSYLEEVSEQKKKRMKGDTDVPRLSPAALQNQLEQAARLKGEQVAARAIPDDAEKDEWFEVLDEEPGDDEDSVRSLLVHPQDATSQEPKRIDRIRCQSRRHSRIAMQSIDSEYFRTAISESIFISEAFSLSPVKTTSDIRTQSEITDKKKKMN